MPFILAISTSPDIFDKKLPYGYNICPYILEELCDKGVIDVFEMAEAIILLRKKYKMPVISIYGKKDSNSNSSKRLPGKVFPGQTSEFDLIPQLFYKILCNTTR